MIHRPTGGPGAVAAWLARLRRIPIGWNVTAGRQMACPIICQPASAGEFSQTGRPDGFRKFLLFSFFQPETRSSRPEGGGATAVLVEKVLSMSFFSSVVFVFVFFKTQSSLRHPMQMSEW